MTKRPSWRELTMLACASSFRWKDREDGGMPIISPIFPADKPAGPACTRARKIARWEAWASAARAATTKRAASIWTTFTQNQLLIFFSLEGSSTGYWKRGNKNNPSDGFSDTTDIWLKGFATLCSVRYKPLAMPVNARASSW
jgi:hypothetical protein